MDSPIWYSMSINWDIRIYGNNIFGNSVGIFLNGAHCTNSSCFEDSVLYDATENWWGTNIEADFENKFHILYDRRVDYSNWLSAQVLTFVVRQTNGIHWNNIENDSWNIYIASDPNNIQDLTEPPPSTLLLFNNYPNPFNPETNIIFHLSKAEMVNLWIYNSLGQRISTLINGELLIGNNKVIWNGIDEFGINAASGIYFCVIKAGTTVKRNRMVLIR
jgi:hypothetical protein